MNSLAGDNWLLGDSGYPCTSTLLTPIRDANSRPKKNYNKAHKKTRVLIEQVFGWWKRRFSILYSGMRFKTPRTRVCSLAIMCCAMLHNLAIFRELPVIEDVEFIDNQPRNDDAPRNVHGERVQDMIAFRYFS